jgi:opacity protein-like surface antigen
MKKSIAPKLAALAGVAALSVSSVNAAESGLYTKLDAGVSFINNIAGLSFDAGFATNGAVGFNLNEHFGLELEGGYAINGVKSALGVAIPGGVDVSSWSGFANVMLRTNLGESLSAFVGGGPGFVHYNLDAWGYSLGSDTGFAGQAKTGIALKVSEQISVDLTYRARFIESNGVGSAIVNHQITGGISIGF